MLVSQLKIKTIYLRDLSVLVSVALCTKAKVAKKQAKPRAGQNHPSRLSWLCSTYFAIMCSRQAGLEILSEQPLAQTESDPINLHVLKKPLTGKRAGGGETESHDIFNVN